MEWFLYDMDLRHERVQEILEERVNFNIVNEITKRPNILQITIDTI